MTTMAPRTRASGRPRTGHFSGKYQVLGDARLSPEEEVTVQEQVEQLESEPLPISTALRWSRPQVEIIRRAARLAGVPYQSYLKQAAIRTALQDLKTAREAGIELESVLDTGPQRAASRVRATTAIARADVTEQVLVWDDARSSDLVVASPVEGHSRPGVISTLLGWVGPLGRPAPAGQAYVGG